MEIRDFPIILAASVMLLAIPGCGTDAEGVEKEEAPAETAASKRERQENARRLWVDSKKAPVTEKVEILMRLTRIYHDTDVAPRPMETDVLNKQCSKPMTLQRSPYRVS